MYSEEKIIRRVHGQLERLSLINDTMLKSYGANDLRTALVGFPANALHALLLNFVMFDSTVCQIAWWNKTHNRTSGPNVKDMEAIQSLEIQTRKGSFIEFASRIEWGYRKLASHLYPGKGTKGESWSNLYRNVHASLFLNKYDPLFDVCRCIRNTIHSNGIYIDKFKQKDSEYTWNGTKYEFKHLNSINFLSWDTYHILVDGNIDAIEALLANSTISNFTHIPDSLQ